MSIQDHSGNDKWTETRVRAISQPKKLVQEEGIRTVVGPHRMRALQLRDDPLAPYAGPRGIKQHCGPNGDTYESPEPGPIIREHYPIDPDVLTVGKRPKGSV